METVGVNPVRLSILVVSNYEDFHSVRPEAEIFLALRSYGVNITILTPNKGKYVQIFKNSGIHVIGHTISRKYDKGTIQLLREIIILKKINVVHLYNNRALINGLLACKRLKDIVVIGYRGTSSNMSFWNIFNYFKHYSPRINHVICNSQSVAKKYYSNPFFDSSKIHTIPKGHNLAWYENVDKIDLEKHYNFATDTPKLITVANERRVKGLKYLCQAINQIEPSYEFKFLIIGDKTDSTKYKSILAKGVHSDKCLFLGFRPNALEYMKSSDIYVLPSIGAESYTKALIEAMCLALCPIATNIEGNKGLIINKQNGVLVKRKSAKKLAKAIMYILDNRALISQYGNASSQRVHEHFNFENAVNGYLSLYQQIDSKK